MAVGFKRRAHSHGEAIARLACSDEGRARRFVAQGGVIPGSAQRHACGYERQLEHHATGRYSADYRHPIA